MDAPTPAPEPLEVLTIDRPEQIKALGHPLRLRVLELLGETGEELSNRELASRLGVDPGHLHFHVRMLVRAGLIRPVEGAGRAREKPYRAVAKAIRVAPELLGTGSTDIHAAMLEEVQRGWEKFGPEGRFRSAQLTARLKPRARARALAGIRRQGRGARGPELEPVLDHPRLAPLHRGRLGAPGRQQRRAELGRQPARLGQRLEHDHGVGDRNVLEVLVARLERLEHALDRLDVAEPVAGGEGGERVGHVAREVVSPAQSSARPRACSSSPSTRWARVAA